MKAGEARNPDQINGVVALLDVDNTLLFGENEFNENIIQALKEKGRYHYKMNRVTPSYIGLSRI